MIFGSATSGSEAQCSLHWTRASCCFIQMVLNNTKQQEILYKSTEGTTTDIRYRIEMFYLFRFVRQASIHRRSTF